MLMSESLSNLEYNSQRYRRLLWRIYHLIIPIFDFRPYSVLVFDLFLFLCFVKNPIPKCFILILIFEIFVVHLKIHEKKHSHSCYRRVPNQPQIPAQMRQQINQAVGQAVTNAAVNELTSVFASKFK